MPAAVSIPMAAGQHQRQQHHRRMSSAGSPMSFKMAGSYGSYGRPAIYPAACSPSQLLGPLDVPDFMMALSTSLESTSISDSLHRPRPELSSSFKRYAFEHLATPVSDLDFCRNYQCCGIALNDLHALVEHFEEVHVQVILDDDAVAAQQAQDNSGASSSNMLDASGSTEGTFQLDEDDIDMDLEEEDSSESSGSLPGTPNGPVSAGNNNSHNNNTDNAGVPQYAASWMQPPTSAFESASVFASSGGASSARSAPASRRPSPRTSPLLSTTSDGTHRSLTMPPAPLPDSPTYLSAPFSATSSAFAFSSHSPYTSGPSTPLASGASTPVRSEYFSYAAANPMLGANGGAGGNTTPPGSASHHHPLALGSYLNFQQVQRSHSLPAGTLGLGTSTALLNGHSPLTPFADSPYSAESAFGDIDGPTHTLTHHHPHAHHHHHSLHHHQQAFAQYNLHHSHHHHGGSQSPLILGGGADSPLGGADSLDGEPNCITPAALVYSNSNPPPPSQTPTPINPAANGDAKGSLPPPPTVKVSKTSTKSAETLLKEGGVMLPSGFVLSPERAERLAQLERGVERTDRPPPGTKPFRCPTPMCTKSYKQANGLKYHITHGQCSFLPPDPELGGLSDREADERMRPFVCAVGSGTGGKGGGCGRRYKNMNGLRYHYQHSGAHGAAGLAMLAAGTHPQPPVFPKSNSSHHHRSSDPSASSSATPGDSTGSDEAPIAGGSRSQPASRPGSSQGKVRAGGVQRGTSASRSSRGSPGTVSASNSRPPSRAASVMAAHSHYIAVPMGVGVGGVGMGMGGVSVGMDFSHHQPYGGAPAERMQSHQQAYGAYGAPQFEMEFGLVEGSGVEAGAAGAGANGASQQQTTAGGQSTTTPTYLMGTTSVVPTTAMPISMKAPLSMSIKPPTTSTTATPVGGPIPPMKSSSSSLAGALDLATSIKK